MRERWFVSFYEKSVSSKQLTRDHLESVHSEHTENVYVSYNVVLTDILSMSVSEILRNYSSPSTVSTTEEH